MFFQFLESNVFLFMISYVLCHVKQLRNVVLIKISCYVFMPTMLW